MHRRGAGRRDDPAERDPRRNAVRTVSCRQTDLGQRQDIGNPVENGGPPPIDADDADVTSDATLAEPGRPGALKLLSGPALDTRPAFRQTQAGNLPEPG
jgi:hypothetical protein